MDAVTEILQLSTPANHVADGEKMMNRRNFCTWLGGSSIMTLVDYDAAVGALFGGNRFPETPSAAQCL